MTTMTSPTTTIPLTALADELDARYAALRQAAEMFADFQQKRIQFGNQVASGTVEFPAYLDALEGMKSSEKAMSAQLVKVYRETVPAGVLEWQGSPDARGIGEHNLARLLGATGHPRLALPKHWARNTTVADDEFGDSENPKCALVRGEPFLRSPSQLWQYCGVGQAGQRQKGMTQEELFALGRPQCKMLVWQLANRVLQAQVRHRDDGERYATGPLGELYLDTRAKYEARGHSGPCPGGSTLVNGRAIRVRCKVNGHYAEAGDPFQPSHILAIALRRLGKEILLGLYDAAYEDWCDR